MLQRAGHLFPLGHVCPCCLSNHRRFSRPYEALGLHLSPMQSSCDTVRKPTRAPAPLGTPVRTVAGGQHCMHCPHSPVHTLTGPAASRSRQLMLRASAPDPPCGRCDPPSFSVSCARLTQPRARWAERMPLLRLGPVRGGPPAATVDRALGRRPFPSRWVLFSSRLGCSSRLLILEANEQSVSSWCKHSLFSGRRVWRGRPSGGWACPGTAATLRFMGVYSSQALKSWAVGGAGWPGAPSGRPQSPEGPALGSPRLRASWPHPRKPSTWSFSPHVGCLSQSRPSSAGRGRAPPLLPAGGLLCLPRPPGAVLSPWQLALGRLLLGGVLFSGLVTVQADTLSPWDQGEPTLISDKHVRNDSRAYAGFFLYYSFRLLTRVEMTQ